MADQGGIIGFYSPDEEPQPWKSRLELDLPEFRFEPLENVSDVDCVHYALVWNPPVGFLNQFVNLKAVFVFGAGVDSLLRDKTLPPVPIVKLSDAGMANQMAHYVAYGVLHFHRRFDEYRQFQMEQRWSPILDISSADQFPIGVLGLGAIGSVVAKQIARLGFPVLGWSNSPKQIDGVRTYVGDDNLAELLRESRVLVNLLPLTHKTENLIDRSFIKRMRPGAFLINIGRGRHVREDDLLESLEEGLLSGAMLDVFDEEPLPNGSPLWRHPNLLITPHVSGITMPEIALDQIVKNIQLIEFGETPRSLVDLDRGY